MIDLSDVRDIWASLSLRNPFSSKPTSNSIASGIVAGNDVNVDHAKVVGEKITIP